MKGVLILRRIKVQNANAIAGLTWGFPAISNFLGFTHALQRQFDQVNTGRKLPFMGCGIICHQHEVQAYAANDFANHVFALTRNPLDKTGKSSSFNEEGRMHMEVSLVIPLDGSVRGGREGAQKVAHDIKELALRQRLAGGSIIDIKKAEIWAFEDDDKKQNQTMRRILRSLLPGFALVSRKASLAEHQIAKRAQSSELAHYDCVDPDLQAWLEFSSLATKPEAVEGEPSTADIEWPRFHQQHGYTGWLRPIAIGYKGISPLYEAGEVANSRDAQTPVRFVETLYSLGEWLSPHRLKSIEQLYWFYQQDKTQNHYLCVNNYTPVVETYLTDKA